MVQPNWQQILTDMEIPAVPDGGLWTQVVDWLAGPRKYKIAAQGTWGTEADRMYGPDGNSWSAESLEGCLHSSSGRGALIGKISGGTADRTGYIFPIGRLTIIEIPENTAPGAASKGALFVTMNDEPARFREHIGSVLISIWEAA